MDNPWEVLPRKCRALMSAQITAWALVERLGTVRALTSLGMWCDTWLGTARTLIEITAGALHERCPTSEIMSALAVPNQVSHHIPSGVSALAVPRRSTSAHAVMSAMAAPRRSTSAHAVI